MQGNIIIAGDININLLKCNGQNIPSRLLNTMNSHGMSLCVTRPTRFNDQNVQNSSLIDHIFTNARLLKCSSYVINYPLSDHLPLLFTTNIEALKTIIKTNTYRQILPDNIEKIRTNLLSVNWDNLFDNKSIDDKFNLFLNILFNIYDKNCPIKTKQSKINYDKSPWLNSDTMRLIKNKYTLYKLKKNNIISNEYFKEYCKDVQKQIKKRKDSYYENKLLNSNNKKKWSTIKESLGMGGKNSHNNCDNDNLTIATENGDITDQYAVAMELNRHFSSIGKKTTDTIPKPKHHFSK